MTCLKTLEYLLFVQQLHPANNKDNLKSQDLKTWKWRELVPNRKPFDRYV